MSLLNNSSIAKITWELENFQNLGTGFQFKPFRMPTNDKTKFQLSCYPKYVFAKFGDNHTLIWLYLETCDKPNPLFLLYRLSILNATGQKWKTQEGNISCVTRLYYGAYFQIYREQLLEPANELLVNGNLKIYCEIEDITNEIAKNSISNQYYQNIAPNKLTEDYKSLLEGGKFSDVSLFVGGKKLLVHKAILSAWSKVFAAMFENDCEENRQNRVEITDISAEVCEHMLRYIYTGQILSDMSEYAADLFVAADKYQLEHLKDACEQYLSSKIDVDTSASTLLLADMHHAMDLKTSCIEFIVKHGEKVIASDGWKAISNARPELGLELFERIVKKN